MVSLVQDKVAISFTLVAPGSGTKLSTSSCAISRFTSRSASRKSFLRPRCPRLDCACARCRFPASGPASSRLRQAGCQYRSSVFHTGRQYCAVDSMTASCTSCSISHAATCFNCSGGCAELASFERILARSRHVGHDHCKRLLVNINSRYSVSHRYSPGRERRACQKLTLRRVTWLSTLPRKRRRPFIRSNERMLRIRQTSGLYFSTALTTSPPHPPTVSTTRSGPFS